jgi:hypothetical protein
MAFKIGPFVVLAEVGPRYGGASDWLTKSALEAWEGGTRQRVTI